MTYEELTVRIIRRGSCPHDVPASSNLESSKFRACVKFAGKADTLSNSTALYHLDLSTSHFEGANIFDNLAGDIPISHADCANLENLFMQANFFQGTIPPNLASLKSIQQLDLSSNNLTGPIPKELEKLQFLSNNSGSRCIVVYFLVYHKGERSMAAGFSSMPARIDELLLLSYHELLHATSGFSPENLIGSGNFGSVYKGRLEKHGNKLVAVKVLDLQKNGASKSFKAECKALRNIRHRNLVSIVSYCSSIDSKGDEFKALIYEFMENGNLDLWLHPSETTDQATSSRSLNLLQKLNIGIDVASALQYLHDHCEAEIVHCDLKPSNILLDNDLVAHVGDFGLARLLPKPINTSSEQGTSSTIAIKGSIGYAAPEYGMGVEASILEDVYSYGILLLEMITRKRPTDDMFMDEFDLHNFVKRALP
nr:putative receptor-like protein kinase At3g47110 [Coffea arabica]